jgi:hypothetical protein
MFDLDLVQNDFLYGYGGSTMQLDATCTLGLVRATVAAFVTNLPVCSVY